MQTLQKPDVLAMPFGAEADTGTINEIPVNPIANSPRASLKKGFPQKTMLPIGKGGEPPLGQDFNGLLNKDSQFYFAFQNGWLPTFDEDVSEAIGGYPEGAILWYNNGVAIVPVKSLIADNTYNFNTNPEYIDGAHWTQIMTVQYTGNQPVGQIIQMLCTEEYVPVGTLPADGTEYTKAQFIDLWTNYLTGNSAKLPTCTYEEYSEAITEYGMCGKFAIDTENLKFRVPLIKDGAHLQQALTNAELSKEYNAGLPNIEGLLEGMRSYDQNASVPSKGDGALKVTRTAVAQTFYDGTDNASGYKMEFDASWDNPIYGNSTTVQPNAIAVRFFVVVADGSINQSQMDWSAWASGLQNKLNTDHSNDSKPYIKESYSDNDGNWYRIWSDNFCEQGGRGTNTSGAGFETITLLKEMRDTNYTLLNCHNSARAVGDQRDAYIISTTQIGLGWDNTQVGGAIWKVEGYIL